jgi:signal transduction histidine kinase
MPDRSFPRLVSLACHDLRTPLATIYGFARTLARTAELDERSARFLQMIEEASAQMTDLLDQLGIAARIEGGRWEPGLREADTLALAASVDPRVSVVGDGEPIETDPEAVTRSLAALAQAALRHGPVDRVTWDVRGRELALSPVLPAAAPVVTGKEDRDLGSLVARIVIEALGGTLELDRETLHVAL